MSSRTRASLGPSVKTKRAIAAENAAASKAGTKKAASKPAAKKARVGEDGTKSKYFKDDDTDEDEAEPSSEDDEGSAYGEDDEGEAEAEEEEEEASESPDTDDIDEEENSGQRGKKRKSTGSNKGKGSSPAKAAGRSNSSKTGSSSPMKGGRVTKIRDVVKAPTTTVPKGQIAPSTMNFLEELAQAGNNEREWFWAHDPVYRHALRNWSDFVDALSPELNKVDWSVPDDFPAKDLVHRIARDVRFSNDKTPYKLNFSAAFSRTGRKGPFAGYYTHIQPGNKSIVAGGKWAPEKNDLASIRHAIVTDAAPLRAVISEPEFVKHFGPPKEGGKGKGKRCNIFGSEDALKNCPKYPGVTKDHPDIDLLKLRTISVVYNFTDDEVLAPDFVHKLAKVMGVMAPLVQLLNEMLVPTSVGDGDEDAGAEEDADGEE